MNKRVKGKIDEIEKYLRELKGIAPESLQEYKSNIEKKAACERYVEKIVEAVTDIAFLMIKLKKLEIPEDDVDAFNILLNHKIIGSSLSAKLKNAKGMRNIIAHEYCKIDDGIVFDSIAEELEEDVSEFIKAIKAKN